MAAALVAMVALGVNDSWHLPSLDADGVRAVFGAEGEAAGLGSALPLGPWDGPSPWVAPRGPTRALIAVYGVVHSVTGVRAHVAAMWVTILAVALTVLATGWVAGGGGGEGAGVLAGAFVVVSALAVEVGTTAWVDPLAAAGVALTVAALTWSPGASWLHGTVAVLTWVVAPAGGGACAAAVVWPFVRPTAPGLAGARVRRAGLAAAIAAVPTLAVALAALTGSGPGLAGPRDGLAEGARGALADVLGWAGGVEGTALAPAAVALGVGALALVAWLAVRDARATPQAPLDTPWYAPEARDLVARRARRAAALAAVASLLAVLFGGRGEELARAGFALVPPLAVLAGLSIARQSGRLRGAARAGMAVAVGAWFLVSGWGAWERAADIRASGRGHTARGWVASPLIRWIDNQAPRDRPLFADEPELVFLQTGRGSIGVAGADPSEEAFRIAYRRRPGPVVLTGAGAAAASRWSSAFGLAEAVRTEDGVILVPERPGPATGGAPDDGAPVGGGG